jgi:hypothetical protein
MSYMKNIVKLLFGAIFTAALFSSCSKSDNKIFYEGGTNPVLTASSTSALVLTLANKNNVAVTFNWTNPNYQFTTGISSQDVNYTLQIDTTNSNFTNPGLAEIGIAKDLSYAVTVGDLNSKLLAMGLLENIPHNLEIRVKSALVNSTIPLYSNVIKIVVTPYLDVVYPVPANLYITGSATPASWQCGCGEAPLASQTFTKVSSSKFELNLVLSAGNSYLFLPVYGSWSAKYGGTGAANNSNNVNGDDFKPNGSDLLAPSVTKSYKITVDFKTGKFTIQ